jgi:glucosamine-6-phosphate deaminase
MTALIFLEWISNNPNGVIALPTGNITEYFIKD